MKNGDFLSDTLRFHFPAVDKETSAKWAHLDRIALTRWGKEIGKKLVTFKFLEDNGKAPMNNKPASAMLSLQALNAFFSNNIAANSNGTVDRRAYGYLVAHVTGLDQRKCKVYRVFDEMSEMANIIQRGLLRSGYDLRSYHDSDKLLDIDMITVKAYYRFFDPKEKKWRTKKLNTHTDIKYSPSGAPERDNNQEAGLPVVIYNLGDPKYLRFELIDWYTGKPIPGEEFEIEQRTNHCFVLNAEDEVPKWRGRTQKKYWSYWAHSSRLVDPNGVSISIQFRFGNTNLPVDVNTNELQKTCQSAATNKKFDQAKNKPWMSGKNYEKCIAMVYEQLKQRFT